MNPAYAFGSPCNTLDIFSVSESTVPQDFTPEIADSAAQYSRQQLYLLPFLK